MELRITPRDAALGERSERAEIYADDGTRMSWAGIRTVRTRFADRWISGVCFGGVGTAPEYRRSGYVRRIFDDAFARSEKEAWTVALLHPFSFSYYRKFGFERVCDHLIVTLPMTALSHIPRVSECKPLTEARLPDVLRIFEDFAKYRNLTIARTDASRWDLSGKSLCYIWYRDGEPRAYVSYTTAKKYIENHMGEGVLNVTELAFVDRESLWAILGFLRMYKGELETVRFNNVAAVPELELTLREYLAEKLELVPDVAARVLDTAALLDANTYPKVRGMFTVRVNDTLPKVRGVWRVRYGGGGHTVERLPDAAACDLEMDAAAFTQTVYGYNALTAELARYMEHVTLYTDAEDFFRAFPKRICGIFEHF